MDDARAARDGRRLQARSISGASKGGPKAMLLAAPYAGGLTPLRYRIIGSSASIRRSTSASVL